MSTLIPIRIVRIRHGGPPGTVLEHTDTLRPQHPECSCGHIRAVWQEDGSLSLEGDEEYFPVTITEVNPAGGFPLISEVVWS
jgi:hypothetical protein